MPLDSLFIVLWLMSCTLFVMPFVFALISPPFLWLLKRCGIVITIRVSDRMRSFWETAMNPITPISLLVLLFLLQLLFARMGLVTGPGKPH